MFAGMVSHVDMHHKYHSSLPPPSPQNGRSPAILPVAGHPPLHVEFAGGHILFGAVHACPGPQGRCVGGPPRCCRGFMARRCTAGWARPHNILHNRAGGTRRRARWLTAIGLTHHRSRTRLTRPEHCTLTALFVAPTNTNGSYQPALRSCCSSYTHVRVTYSLTLQAVTLLW